jgi:hypothetical protein
MTREENLGIRVPRIHFGGLDQGTWPTPLHRAVKATDLGAVDADGHRRQQHIGAFFDNAPLRISAHFNWTEDLTHSVQSRRIEAN